MNDELYEGTARPLENYSTWRQVCPCGIPTAHGHPPPVTPVPIDWPARFRAAAEVAERERAYGIADHLQRGADDLPPAVLAVIGRALLGEEP